MKKLIIGILILFTSALYAQIPKVLSYQGYITDAGGTPRNGNAIITFKLYDAPSGGNMLWSEVDKTVIVEKGFFATLLGSPTSFGTLAFDKQYYLTLTPQGENEITPRVPLTSSAYSLNSITVSDGAITPEKLSDNAITNSKLSDNSVTTNKITNSTIAKEDLAANVISAMLPVGTIVASMLTEAQFNTEMGGGNNWALCDGRSVTGTRYAQLVSVSIPDLRGIFLRGAGTNSTRTSSNGVKYAGGSVGNQQQDQLQAHTHIDAGHSHQYNCPEGPQAVYGGGVNAGSFSPNTSTGYASLGQPTETDAGVPRIGAETKPASTSVNYFIKVN